MKNNTQTRLEVGEVIFTKCFDGDEHTVLFGDLPKDLLPTDSIDIIRDEGYYSENNSWDPFTEIRIIRKRLENDKEFNYRIEENRKLNLELKDRRFQTYLKLKNEFETNKIE